MGPWFNWVKRHDALHGLIKIVFFVSGCLGFVNQECFIYVERTCQIWPSTHVGHMSDTGIGKTRLNRVSSAYQEIKKKKKKNSGYVPDMFATRQVHPRHWIAWKKSWFLHLGHYRPSIKLKAFSLSLTRSASLSCFPLGLPSRISLQCRLAINDQRSPSNVSITKATLVSLYLLCIFCPWVWCLT